MWIAEKLMHQDKLGPTARHFYPKAYRYASDPVVHSTEGKSLVFKIALCYITFEIVGGAYKVGRKK